MTIRVYNSWSQKKEDFKELHPGEVRMYVCGPTVYDDSHIGHGRAAVTFDIIQRYFKFRGYRVNYVRNYTDVDDKIINRANQDKVDAADIAEKYIKSYEDDMSGLGVEQPTVRPRVSEHIPDIIETIQRLIDKGFAYVSAGDVFFAVRKFHRYGALSRRSLDEMQAGARVEVNEQKQDPLDFALWKAAKPGEPKWPSPWGEGRPGWHIECSVMSAKYLGLPFDIHGGGKDLLFPHHENEVAQSEAAFGKKMVNYWLHNGFVQINHEKMSKSLGNILLIRDLLKRYNRETVRYFYCSSHWRSPIDFSEQSLLQADEAVDRFYQAFHQIEKLAGLGLGQEPLKDDELANALAKLEPEFIAAMDDDFNTAQVVGNFNEFLRLLNQRLEDGRFRKKPGAVALLVKSWSELKRLGAVLGLFQEKPSEYIEREKRRGLIFLGLAPEELESQIQARARARAEKDFARADAIRAELAERGIILEDTREGTEWKIDRKKLAEKCKLTGGGQ
jgi:cysteinyl-tRNA synthetase